LSLLTLAIELAKKLLEVRENRFDTEAQARRNWKHPGGDYLGPSSRIRVNLDHLAIRQAIVIAAYIENHPMSVPTVKQHLAAIRMPFDFLVTGKIVPMSESACRRPRSCPRHSGTINAMGGVPIKVGDQVIGAVSVSGAPGGDKDAACANAALTKVEARLK
jgi:hypothetical protein